MEAYNRFYKCIFKWERALLKLVGHDALADKLKPTPMTFVVYGSILAAFLMAIYTIINYGLLEKAFSCHSICLLIQVFKVRLKVSMIIQ